MQAELVYIDAVLPQGAFAQDTVSLLQLEWFEVNKKRLTRATTTGQTLLMELEKGREWCSGDGLFHEGKLIATIAIKPTLTICFSPVNTVQAADFSYYLGNRHLPLFMETNRAMYRVPYDGRLYEQLLAKFQSQVQLEDGILLSENLVKRLIKKSRNENEL
jgi:urease accessory protein